MATIHVLGAGVAGLACAVRCAAGGSQVVLYEAANHAGGRARSFRDESLGCMIDNGNHMLLGSNAATHSYLSEIGAADAVREIDSGGFPFIDMQTGARYRFRPGGTLLPLWLMSADRRIPGTSAGDYVRQGLRLKRARAGDTVADAVGANTPLYRALWEPLCRAALNAPPERASARLLWKVVRESFTKGERASHPFVFHKGLSAALVTPALRLLKEHDAEIRFSARIRGMRWADHRVTALHFPKGQLRIGEADAVVLALPPEACGEIWPEADPPADANAILNIHYRLDEPLTLPWDMPFVGVLGTETQWIYIRDNVLSLTISAAGAIADRPNWELANQLWGEVGRILGRSATRLPAWRVIKERRATFAQTPDQAVRRAKTTTSLRNLFLAGDWTDTGLPATIEGAVQSGFKAASQALSAVRNTAADKPQ
jgi:squalene-associated FAD-dependent desaturase